MLKKKTKKSWARRDLDRRLEPTEVKAVRHLVLARYHLAQAGKFIHAEESTCDKCGLNKQEPQAHWVAETSRKSALTRVLRAIDQFGAGCVGEWDFPEIPVKPEKTAS